MTLLRLWAFVGVHRLDSWIGFPSHLRPNEPLHDGAFATAGVVRCPKPCSAAVESYLAFSSQSERRYRQQNPIKAMTLQAEHLVNLMQAAFHD